MTVHRKRNGLPPGLPKADPRNALPPLVRFRTAHGSPRFVDHVDGNGDHNFGWTSAEFDEYADTAFRLATQAPVPRQLPRRPLPPVPGPRRPRPQDGAGR